MKHHIHTYILTASLSCLLSCTGVMPEEDSGRLYLSVRECPYLEDGPQTRALTSGFLTTLEPGDTIGVTAVGADGRVLPECDNQWFAYDSASEKNGVICATFLNERGYAFVERYSGARYFAYFPYSKSCDGMTLDEIVASHELPEDQSTREAFTAADLMTTDEAVFPQGSVLPLSLKHRMATISIFYNNEWTPQGDPLYTIHLSSATTPSSMTIGHSYRSETAPGTREHRRRYLVDPRKTPKVKLAGRLEEPGVRFFSHSIDVKEGHLYSVSFEGEPMVPYTDGVDLELDSVRFADRNGDTLILGHTVYWSRYNLGESQGETYPFEPADGDLGGRTGTREPRARGDYYSWGATFTQYDNGLTGYRGYGFNNYFDNTYSLAPLGGTIKETEYDVAHARWWRGKWRLPTENEFRAMYAGCTFEKVDSYTETQMRYMGTPGTRRTFFVYKVTSRKNPEKFIYLSSGGYLDGTMEAERDSEGDYTSSGDGKVNQGIVSPTTAYYMTSSASPTILRCVSYAYFNSVERLIKVDGSRYTGMLVRPVYSPNEQNF